MSAAVRGSTTTPTLHALFDTRLPIIQAPMAGAQAAAMALATTNAGGLGSLPCALLTHETLHTELTTLARDARGPFNVNFFCHTPPVFDAERDALWRAALAPYFAELGIDTRDIPGGPGRVPFDHDVADIVEPFKPSVVSFHFGLPAPDLLARVRGWGAKVISSATTVDEARWLEARGVDAIIAQGLEAGGHRGMFLTEDLSTQSGTFALLPQIVRAVQVPIIAAGGIADAGCVAAAIALGAAGVQAGTAYLLCPEALTSDLHRNAIEQRAHPVTALTNLFTGRPARGIINRLMRELGPTNAVAPAFPLATAAVATLRAAAERRGSSDFSPLWAGQNITGCRRVPAAEITLGLADGIRA
ncbi:MAG: nitronate monooxygenase [Gemmatimonadota bacterium]